MPTLNNNGQTMRLLLRGAVMILVSVLKNQIYL